MNLLMRRLLPPAFFIGLFLFVFLPAWRALAVEPAAPTIHSDYLLDDFDGGEHVNFRGGTGDRGGNGNATLSGEKAHSGKQALRWEYQFARDQVPTPGFIYSRCYLETRLPGKPQTFSIWIHADAAAAGYRMRYRFADATGRTWQGLLCTIDWTGWKLVSGKFDAALQPQWGGKETPGGFSYPLSFSELTLDTGTAASAPSGAFYLDDFRVQSLFAGSDIMMADLTTAWPSNAGVGNDPGVKLRIHNFDERDRHINITCIVQDLWGTVIPQGKITPMVAHAGTITQMPIAMTLPHRGYYTATFTLTAADTPGWRIQRSCSLASLPPVPNTIDAASPFGVNGHTSGEHMNEYGVGFSRTDWFWGFAQPRADTWDFTAYDRMLDNIHAHHLEIFPVITYNPGWLKPKAGFGTDHAAYLTYVRRTVERYKGRVRYWDLWNEPDLTWHGSPQEFGDVMYEAYKIIKEVDPQATVVYPSISGANLDGFLTESLTSLHGHFPFDVLGIHPYTRPLSPDEGNLQQVLLRAKQWMAAHGDSKPIWISECGWPTATDNSSVTEMQQAAYLTRLFTIALSAGVQKTVWYQPFSGTNPDDPESEFGFLRHDYSPKPASCALAQLTHRLRGAKYLRELHLGTFTRCYLFQTSTQTVAILYATKRPFQLNLQLPKGLVLEAMDGAPLPARTPINIGAEPVYFVIQNKQEQSLEQALLQHRMTNAVPADIELSLQAQRVVVDIKNALIHPLTATVTVQGPTGWTFRDGAQRTVTLSPEGETTLTFPVSYPQNAIQSTIHLLFSALGRKTDLAFPVRIIPIPRVPSAVKIDGTLDEWTASPTVVLNKSTDVAPGAMQAHWKGMNDLSANTWWGWDARGLYLAAAVRDDVQRNVQTGKLIWSGDGLQIAINHDTGIVPPMYDDACNEFGCALGSTGDLEFNTWNGKTLTPDDYQLAITRDTAHACTNYELFVSWGALGMRTWNGRGMIAPQAGAVFGVSLLVNEDDGEGRKSWLQYSPGIAETKNPALYPRFILAE